MKQKKAKLLAIFLSLCVAAGSAGTLATAAAAEVSDAAETAAVEMESAAESPAPDADVESQDDTSVSDEADAVADESNDDTSAPETPSSPKTGWKEENGKIYYYNSDGTLYTQTGFQTIDGKKYYFNSDHSIQIGWMLDGNDKYYFDSDGVMQTGLQTISGKTYYFDSNGVMYAGFKTIGDKRYYFQSNGVRYETAGWKTINGKKRYFTSNYYVQTGLKQIDGKYYYFTDAGAVKTGFLTIDGHRYYFESNGARLEVVGWKTIDGKKYNFTSKYYVRTGWKTINGKKYYFGSNGARQTGLKTISKNIYYFDSNGVMQKSKWINVRGKRYHLNSSGVAAKGWTKLNGYRYYFNSQGVLKEDVRNRSDVKGPYRLIVSLKECTVLVLAKGTDGVYDIPAAKFVCSPGKASTPTPTGTYTSTRSARWQPLMGPSWGQYGLHVVSGIFFHSIPCAQANIYNIPRYDYETLGYPASHGCIRLLVRDEKWIYDHAGSGITTTITNSTSRSVISYLKKPSVPPLADGQTWDPTDPIAIKQQSPKLSSTKPAAGETLYTYQTKTGVNYRSSPSTSASSKGMLMTGAKVKVVKGYAKTANGYKWWKVKIGSDYYYVVSSYLKKTSAAAEVGKNATAATSKPTTTTTTTSTTAKETLVAYKTKINVNYRTGPGLGYSVKKTLAQGTTVQVVKGYSKTADSHKWYKIKIGSSYYYISSDYLQKA